MTPIGPSSQFRINEMRLLGQSLLSFSTPARLESESQSIFHLGRPKGTRVKSILHHDEVPKHTTLFAPSEPARSTPSFLRKRTHDHRRGFEIWPTHPMPLETTRRTWYDYTSLSLDRSHRYPSQALAMCTSSESNLNHLSIRAHSRRRFLICTSLRCHLPALPNMKMLPSSTRARSHRRFLMCTKPALPNMKRCHLQLPGASLYAGGVNDARTHGRRVDSDVLPALPYSYMP
jgi:hypothetical protein